jgi:hypothetical protein
MDLNALNLDDLKKLASANVSVKKSNKEALAKLTELQTKTAETQRKQLAHAKELLQADN